MATVTIILVVSQAFGGQPGLAYLSLWPCQTAFHMSGSQSAVTRDMTHLTIDRSGAKRDMPLTQFFDSQHL